MNRKLYYKDFNGLKFFGFLVIFFFLINCLLIDNNESRTIVELFEFGSRIKELGVECFFFLSAFLITSHGLREYKYFSSFNLKQFYIRRVLRITPVLIISLLFYFFIHPFIIEILKLEPQRDIIPWKGLLFFPTYYKQLSQEVFVYTYVIWMIFMFLQFYVVWGIVLKFLKKYLLFISFLVIAIGLYAKLSLNGEPLVSNFNLLFYCTSIGFGSLTAYLARQNHDIINKIKILSNTQIQLIYTLSIFGLIFINYFFEYTLILNLSNIFISFFFSFMVIEQTYSKHSNFKLRNNKVFTRLGKRSYGLTVFAPIMGVLLITGIESIDQGTDSTIFKFIFPVVTFILTWFFANVFYSFVEIYFYRMKNDYKRS